MPGWSMPVAVFGRLQAHLPEFQHVGADYTTVETAEEMLALTENAARRHGRVLIGGWSLGALLGLRLAAEGLAEGLVLFSGTDRFVRPDEERDRGWPEAYLRGMMTGIRKDREAVEAKFRGMLFTDADRQIGAEELLPGAGSWSTPALLAGLRVLREAECLAGMSRIACPTLLVHGTGDAVCPYGAALEMGERLRQSEITMLEGCGHAPFLGREAFLAEVIRSWWDERANRTSV
nr:alpha/beta fold hydrolase [Cohnella sp. CFH 77786]